MEVPKFDVCFPARSDMDQAQRRFMEYWSRKWRQGTPVNVGGQVSYLFLHAYEVLASEDAAEIATQLEALTRAYSSEEAFAEYVAIWLADAHVLNGDFRAALAALPRPRIGSAWTVFADTALTLKTWLDQGLSGREIVALVGPKVTPYGRKRIDLVEAQLDIEIAALEREEGRSLLQEWARRTRRLPFDLFRGAPVHVDYARPKYYFSGLGEATEFCKDLLRKAENVVREDEGLPHVGEGWIAETELYYRLREAFPGEAIEHHASPSWLGRQHLDIYFPDRGVAIEYQGRQHDEAVAFFGGEDAFRRTQDRDLRKRKRCSDAGVRLHEVRPGYDLKALVGLIADGRLTDE